MSIFDNPDEFFMQQALCEARLAAAEGEIPVGAVIVSDGRILARAHNNTEKLNDVTAHAELLAVTAASGTLGAKYLTGCTLYVTLEPCPMCAGALAWSQISRIVYGASDPKRGFERIGRQLLHPRTEVTAGILADECATLVKEFFKERRHGVIT
ncbi:MAG: nucleoside deaminase [Bacteroidales bacterium]|nr:nucleoside deaminase [Bacteroidales bacterium]MBP5644387.1 nucleoside deaminase [Bacteroidales bacterium]